MRTLPVSPAPRGQCTQWPSVLAQATGLFHTPRDCSYKPPQLGPGGRPQNHRCVWRAGARTQERQRHALGRPLPGRLRCVQGRLTPAFCHPSVLGPPSQEKKRRPREQPQLSLRWSTASSLSSLTATGTKPGPTARKVKRGNGPEKKHPRLSIRLFFPSVYGRHVLTLSMRAVSRWPLVQSFQGLCVLCQPPPRATPHRTPPLDD